MAKNLKAMTNSELAYIHNNYDFELKSDGIVVVYKGFHRGTFHDMNNAFTMFVNNATMKRKITITTDAMQLWANNFKDKYSLIEVQNAINTLIVTYQAVRVSDITLKALEKQLKLSRAKIKNL